MTRRRDRSDRGYCSRRSPWSRRSPPWRGCGGESRDADHHRVGLRRKGNMAPFDGPGARCGEHPREPDQRARRGQRQEAQDHRPATRRTTIPRRRSPCATKPDRQGRGPHVRHLRRRLRDPGRAGGVEPRDARGGTVHRHRPDGAEALRGEGPARLQLRERRPGRGLGDGRLRVEAGLEERGARRPTHFLVYFKNVVQAFETLHAAGRQGRRRRRRTRRAANKREHRGQAGERRRTRTSSSRRPRSASCRPLVAGLRPSGTTRPSSTRGRATAPTGCAKDPRVISNYYFSRSPRRSVTIRARPSTRSPSRSRPAPAGS